MSSIFCFSKVYPYSPNAVTSDIFLLENSLATSDRHPAVAQQLGEHGLHLVDKI